MVQARRSNGKPYQHRTLHSIFSGLQRYYIEEKGINECGFLIKLQAVYNSFRHTLDGVMKKRTEEGLGEVTSYDAVTVNDEVQM